MKHRYPVVARIKEIYAEVDIEQSLSPLEKHFEARKGLAEEYGVASDTVEVTCVGQAMRCSE